MRKSTRFFLTCLALLVVQVSLCQDQKSVTHNSLAEKIYLQLDSEIYTTDKTIWFKAVLANAASHSLEQTSGVLYVDLIDFEDEIVESKLIKIRNGIGQGFFDLDRSYSEGSYRIRAYTEWNKNFENDFIFEKDIQIYAEGTNKNQSKAIDNIRLVDSTTTQSTFKIDFFPELIDAEHKSSLKILKTIDGETDTLYINKSEDDIYTLDISTPKTSDVVTLEFQTRSGKRYSKVFSPNTDYVDLQFFPEGGELVNGLPSKVGFKAIDINGKGKQVEGEIINKDGQVITSFTSNKLGTGHFLLTEVNTNEFYKARLKDSHKTIKLPEVANVGVGLKVVSVKGVIAVGVASNFQKDNKIRLKASVRGVEYFNKHANLLDGKYIYSMAKNAFPEGVIMFTLFDERDVPIAERLFFNERLESRVVIDVITKKTNYSKRDNVVLDIVTRNADSSFAVSNTSVLVLEKNRVVDYGNHNTLLSYLLLSSDVRGQIESPGAYFNTEQKLDIDDLMLTQGWRNYKYDKPLTKLNYPLEKGLSVSGIVNVKNERLKNTKMDFILMSFNDDGRLYTSEVQLPGSFKFQLNDLFSENDVDIAILPSNQSEKKKQQLNIAINEKKQLPVVQETSKKQNIDDSVVDYILQNNTDQKQVLNDYYRVYKGINLLDEVNIEGRKMTPIQKEVFDRYGAPHKVISGKELKENELGWSDNLFDVLSYKFPDVVAIKMTCAMSCYRMMSIASGEGTDHETLIVVDGIPVELQDYPLLLNIPIDAVTSFETLDYSRGFLRLYKELYPFALPPFPEGSIISIYTKNGKGLYGAIKEKSINYAGSIPVFLPEKEFYSPKYDTDAALSFLEPDIRSTLYWNPSIGFNADGLPSINYYHSDNEGDFVVIIESITTDGKIGYKTFDYKVSDANN